MLTEEIFYKSCMMGTIVARMLEPLEKYQISSGKYNYSFYLLPSSSKKGLDHTLEKFNY